MIKRILGVICLIPAIAFIVFICSFIPFDLLIKQIKQELPVVLVSLFITGSAMLGIDLLKER